MCCLARRQSVTDTSTAFEASNSTRTKTKVKSQVNKSRTVTKLLARSRGATVADLTDATGWQPHSIRALLSGLRKKGIVLIRDVRKSGESCYRISVTQPAAGARFKQAPLVPTPDNAKVTDTSATATEAA